jgi:hypothetical protein
VGDPVGRPDYYIRILAAVGSAIFAAVIILRYGFALAAVGVADKSLWDWLELLIVPAVLAVGGYLFTRSESKRTQDIANQQRDLDREIADERRQDDTLQAYLDGRSQLLTDKDRPLHRSQRGDSLSTVARARTLTVLPRLDGDRKARVVQFLYESDLIAKHRPIVDMRGVDLSRVNLSGAYLFRAYLGEADLSGVLGDITNEKLDAQASFPEGANMPNGQKYEDWVKSRGEENSGSQ